MDRGHCCPRCRYWGRGDAIALKVPMGVRSLVPIRCPEVQPWDHPKWGFHCCTLPHHCTQLLLPAGAQVSSEGRRTQPQTEDISAMRSSMRSASERWIMGCSLVDLYSIEPGEGHPWIGAPLFINRYTVTNCSLSCSLTLALIRAALPHSDPAGWVL